MKNNSTNQSSAGLSKDTNQHLQRTYNSEETQEILGVSKSTLDKMCHFRQIPFHLHPQRRKRAFLESDLLAYQSRFVRVPSIDEVNLK